MSERQLPRRARERASQRGISAVNAAVAFALAGSLLAVAVPAFMRELHSSRFAEPTSGLARIGASAIAYAQDRPASDAFPAPSPLTPTSPPRGTREVDPPGTWDTATWQALQFRPVPEGEAHSFAFGFDSMRVPGASKFVAHAHGDLNGNGITSTFELRGRAVADEAAPVLEPSIYVQDEIE